MPSATAIYAAYDRMIKANESGEGISDSGLSERKARVIEAKQAKRALEGAVCDEIDAVVAAADRVTREAA